MSEDLLHRITTALAPVYRVERELGGGGMSHVFLAIETAFDRPVVIKVLTPELGAVVSAERFRQEVRVLARLQHPNIVPLLAAGEVPDLYGPGEPGEYYVMPFVDGPSLRAVLDQRGALPLNDAVAALRDVARALEHAHGRGILHRDIKPGNILMSGGVAVVTDFGIAKALAASQREGASTTPQSEAGLTLSGVALGTPCYMAPEQAVADPATDQRADLYALGVVGFEMVAGEPPFRGTSPQQYATQHLAVPPPDIRGLRPDVPEHVAALIHRLLGKAPAERPADAGEVLRELEQPNAPRPWSAKPRSVRVVAFGLAFVAAAVLVQLARQGAVARPSSVTDSPARRRVLVATLEDRTGRPDLASVGVMASDWIARELAQTGLADVMPAAQLERPGDVVPAPELARRSGAGTVIQGRYYIARGDSVRFELAVLDGASGQVLRALDPVSASTGNLEEALALLQQRVSGALAATVDSVFQTYAAPDATPSFEAYAEFVEAQRLYWGTSPAQQLDWRHRLDSALAHFKRAAALDPGFATSAIWIALVSSVNDDCAVADSVVGVLAPRRAEFGTWDRLLFDLVPRRCAGDWEGALKVSEERGRAFPHSSHVRFLLALYALHANHPRRALEVIKGLDPGRDLGWLPESEPILRYWAQQIDAFTLLGDYGAADSAAARLRQAEPGDPYTAWVRARTLAMAARPEADLMLDSALAYPVGTVRDVNEGALLLRHVRVLAATGQGEAARRVASRGLALAWVVDSLPPMSRAELEELAGNPDAALARVSAAGAQQTLAGYRVRGRIAARRGDRRMALQIDRRLGAITAARLGAPYLGRAEIAALLGDKEQAVALLQNYLAAGGGSAGSGPWIGLRQNPAFATLRGFGPYDRLLEPRS